MNDETKKRECPGYDVCEHVPDPGDSLPCRTTCVSTRATTVRGRFVSIEVEGDAAAVRKALRLIIGGRQP